MCDAGVVHQDVESSECCQGLKYQAIGECGIRNVSRDEARVQPSRELAASL
jgi:hypothetical protein